MVDRVTVCFDCEDDFLEVTFADAPGLMRETANDAIMDFCPFSSTFPSLSSF